MSQQNLDTLRGAYDAFSRGDIPTALEAMTDDVEFVVAENSPYFRGASYVGKSEVAEKLFARAGEEWEGYHIVIQKLHDAGDVVVMQGRYRGTHREDRRIMDVQVAHICTIRDGKLAKLEQYLDTAAVRDLRAGSASAAATK